MKLKKDFKQSIYEHFLCMFIKEIAAFSPTTIHNYDALNQIVTWLEYFRDVMERLDVFY